MLGIVKLILKSIIIIFNECHFYPSFLLIIISIDLLAMKGYEISIKKNYNIILNDVTVMNGQLNNEIYILLQFVSIIYTSSKCPKVDDVSDIYLWYRR